MTHTAELLAEFGAPYPDDGPLRRAIRAAHREPETECVPPLIGATTLDPAMAGRVEALARRLTEQLRAEGPGQGITAVIHEYALSSEEGIALMCLAEALLRIPDDATRDALIRDKVARGDWRAHLGGERTLFVNATTWGLMVTGRLTGAVAEEGLAAALSRLIARGGEPIIRTGVEIAMRLMGEQFVAGETIEEALDHSRRLERRGFRYSYDMLGEAAATAEDAARYFAAYENAIDAIGKAARGVGPIAGPGISIKLSALHPRYRRSQKDRVLTELLPRLLSLARRARRYDIGLNIDAEEAERLELSLDLLEALCFDAQLSGWNGIGFVVQAYGKRCGAVIDWLIDLGRRSGHRLMVRLVKGAYWDSEIKQAQVEGVSDYPVFTRKVHTDVSYLAAARKMLAAPEQIYPQFATHNAQTLASISEMAGPDYWPGQYEFQCLHGMGEPLYAHVVGRENLDRPCRIYAPVGTHGTLLAYLVRRLLENGANTSFVNRIAAKSVNIDALVADPAAVAKRIAPLGSPHPQIALPAHILGDRLNSAGLDLNDENVLADFRDALQRSAAREWTAEPLTSDSTPHPVRLREPPSPSRGEGAPADGSRAQEAPLALGLSVGAPSPPEGEGGPKGRMRGQTTFTELRNPADADDLVGTVHFATSDLVPSAIATATPDWAPVAERTAILRKAADDLQSAMPDLLGLIMREAGKSVANAISEVREAVDFLRYYADQAEQLPATARPLGTVACISPWNFPLSIFTGQVAAALATGNAVIAKPAEETPLIAAAMVDILHAAGVPRGVLQFLPGAGDIGAALCGDPGVAGVIFTGSTEVARLIQKQLAQRGAVPFIAETGGINAMIVDSSALTEQVVADVLASAFDSAGQRCSALRLLCLQEDIADRTLTMLKSAMDELRVGNPGRLGTDVGPVITRAAADRIEVHIAAMRDAGHRVTRISLDEDVRNGTFVAPALIELDEVAQLEREVFGPILHVVRYARNDLSRTIAAINALGYGLTFGLHTRLDATVDRVTAAIHAGNIYVNRNMIGAVVGVQPFGGQGLSGTGPKAGGPLYLRRLVTGQADDPAAPVTTELPGPVGERNVYRTVPRGNVLMLPETNAGYARMREMVAATGNRALERGGAADAVIVEGSAERAHEVAAEVATRDGPIIPVFRLEALDPVLLQHEVAISINTTAAGGNASLMTISEGL